MAKTKRRSAPKRKWAPAPGNIIAGLAIIVIILGFAGLKAFQAASAGNAGAGNGPAKPGGQPVIASGANFTEHWNLAQGLPKQVTQLIFSAHSPAQGYAAVFVNKQTQAVYQTTDQGSTWAQVGTVQAPVADIIASDPTDARDVVLVSVNAPSAGTFSIQRSYDSGHTWQAQTTTLPSSATVIQTGWVDSTFYIGFSLDRQPIGGAALVAFPANQPSAHLDANGKINGVSFAQLRLLTGKNGRLQVWGVDGAGASAGFATTDTGKTWTQLNATVAGATIIPVAATADGATLLASSTDRMRMFVSHDGGATWQAHPTFGNDKVRLDHSIFVAPDGQAFVHFDSDSGSGAHGITGGAWGKITQRDIVAISTDAAGRPARLWAYDDQGQIMWRSR